MEHQLENVENDIKDLRNESRDYVTWKILTWVLGILIVVIGSVFSYLAVKVSAVETDNNTIKIESGKIQVQLDNIIQKQDDLKTLLKEHIQQK